MTKKGAVVPAERVEKAILLVRGQKVILDADLAQLYGVETKQLKRAVRRNISRFSEDFMFQLTKEELDNLRSHFGTSSWGGTRYLPLAFTEQEYYSRVVKKKLEASANSEVRRIATTLTKK